MHVLYFLLKKLMEPLFSEYLVLLKTELPLVTHLSKYKGGKTCAFKVHIGEGGKTYL
jgi:hypothetical protein